MPDSWHDLVEEYQSYKFNLDMEIELDKEDAERWEQLRKLNEEVDDFLDFGPNASCEWIWEGDWKNHVKQFAIDMGWITEDSALFYYIDWEEVGEEQLKPDYDEIEWEGYTYYFKGN